MISGDDALRTARRQVIRARIAVARAGARGRSKAADVSPKALSVAGAAAAAGLVGFVAGYFLAARSKAAPEKPAANDQTLADRVKSEIFRPADAPKDAVKINVEDGVVYLRGQVRQPDQIEKLVEEAGSVDGVRGVENLLHTS